LHLFKDITKLECHLRGCCYDEIEKECNYPSRNFLIPGLYQPSELYPELYAEVPQEAQCQAVSNSGFYHFECMLILWKCMSNYKLYDRLYRMRSWNTLSVSTCTSTSFNFSINFGCFNEKC